MTRTAKVKIPCEGCRAGVDAGTLTFVPDGRKLCTVCYAHEHTRDLDAVAREERKRWRIVQFLFGRKPAPIRTIFTLFMIGCLVVIIIKSSC